MLNRSLVSIRPLTYQVVIHKVYSLVGKRHALEHNETAGLDLEITCRGSVRHGLLLMFLKTRLGLLPALKPYEAFQATPVNGLVAQFRRLCPGYFRF